MCCLNSVGRVGVSGVCHSQCCVMSSVNMPAVDCLIYVSKGEIHSSPSHAVCRDLVGKTRENTSVLHILPFCSLGPNFL